MEAAIKMFSNRNCLSKIFKKEEMFDFVKLSTDSTNYFINILESMLVVS